MKWGTKKVPYMFVYIVIGFIALPWSFGVELKMRILKF